MGQLLALCLLWSYRSSLVLALAQSLDGWLWSISHTWRIKIELRKTWMILMQLCQMLGLDTSHPRLHQATHTVIMTQTSLVSGQLSVLSHLQRRSCAWSTTRSNHREPDSMTIRSSKPSLSQECTWSLQSLTLNLEALASIQPKRSPTCSFCSRSTSIQIRWSLTLKSIITGGSMCFAHVQEVSLEVFCSIFMPKLLKEVM